jgi:Lipocalin-like domain
MLNLALIALSPRSDSVRLLGWFCRVRQSLGTSKDDPKQLWRHASFDHLTALDLIRSLAQTRGGKHESPYATALALLTGIGLVAFSPSAAFSQSANDVVGTWTLVSSIVVQDGKEIDQFGPDAKGMMSLDAGGRFMLTIIGAGLPKFGSNNRVTGTAEENKAVVGKSIAVFGTYSIDVADRIMTFGLETATFPNWSGTEQKRSLVTFSQTEIYERERVCWRTSYNDLETRQVDRVPLRIARRNVCSWHRAEDFLQRNDYGRVDDWRGGR